MAACEQMAILPGLQRRLCGSLVETRAPDDLPTVSGPKIASPA